MSILIFMIPIALFLGLAWLIVFLWSLRSGQYEDMEGAANRILFEEGAEKEKEKTSRIRKKKNK